MRFSRRPRPLIECARLRQWAACLSSQAKRGGFVPAAPCDQVAQERTAGVAEVLQGDRRTIGGRSVLALNGVAPAVIFGDCIRVQTPASSSFASIWLKSEVEKYA